MKRIALIAPYKIDDNGKLYADLGCFSFSTIEFLGKYYDLTIILRRIRNKKYEEIPQCAHILYDEEERMQYQNNSLSGVMERQYSEWKNVCTFQGKWDCVILLHAFSAWGLACALNRTEAACRIIYVQKKVSEYVVSEERGFFRHVFSGFDSIVCAMSCVAADLQELYDVRRSIAIAYCVPNVVSYLEEYQKELNNPFDPKKLILVTRENLAIGNYAERIPALVQKLKIWYPEIQWYLIGEGERLPHLIREIVVRDVCEEVIPVENVEHTYPYMRCCSGVVVFDENDCDTELSAKVLGLPVKRMESSEDADELRQWLEKIRDRKNCMTGVTGWPDWDIWRACIEGGDRIED